MPAVNGRSAAAEGHRRGRERRLIGYITTPIGFIPLVGNFAQLLLQEAAGTILERKLTKQYRWSHMLSDIAYKDGSSNG